jgi:hypothetical protein
MNRFRLTAPPRVKLTENDVEGAALDYLRLRGYYAIRLHVGRYRAPKGQYVTIGEPGLPDWAFIHPDFPGFLLEAKRPGRAADARQLAKHDELRRIWKLGIAVVDSLEELKEFLALHERSAALRWGRGAIPG